MQLKISNSFWLKRKKLRKWGGVSENASTIPGTSSFHQFIPLARDKIAMKQCSEDENYDLIYDFSIGAEEKAINFFVSGCLLQVWL